MFAKIKQLVAQKPAQSLNDPLTEAEVEARCSQLNTAAERLCRARRGLVAGFWAAVAVSACDAVVAHIFGWLNPGLIFIMTIVSLGATVSVAAYLEKGLATLEQALYPELAGYALLAEHNCARMLAACEATSEGQLYRRKVLGLGRQFYRYELTLMEDWASGQSTREACRALYDIQSNNPLPAANHKSES